MIKKGIREKEKHRYIAATLRGFPLLKLISGCGHWYFCYIP